MKLALMGRLGKMDFPPENYIAQPRYVNYAGRHSGLPPDVGLHTGYPAMRDLAFVAAQRSQAPGTTSVTLLEQARRGEPIAWRRLVSLYGPVVFYGCQRAGLREDEQADVAQEVWKAIATEMAAFQHDGDGSSFRGWLWTITRNKVNDHFRRLNKTPRAAGGTSSQDALAQVPATTSNLPDDDDAVKSLVVQQAVKMVRTEFEDRTWQAFQRMALDGLAASDVADELSMTPAAVRKAKSRVMRRLQEELSGAID